MEALFAAETDISVKVAMLPKLAGSLGHAAAPLLLGSLESDDYRLRAAAVAGFKGFTGEAVDMVKPLLHRREREVRIAAAQVLLDAGEEAWLESRQISNGAP